MPAAPKNKFIRNVRYVPVSIRLGSGRRIDLKPRGMRGDCVPVTKEEQQDEIYMANEGLLFELITSADAEQVISKQQTNQQMAHPALGQIRNALGEEYERGVVVEENFTEQGQKVGTVNNRGMIERFVAPGTIDMPLPEVPDSAPPEEVSDWVARNAKVEGPEAGLAGLKVSVDKPQKS